MLIDFSQIKEVKIPGMNDGTGEMSARMYMDEQGKIIYVISGTGKAVCNGQEEILNAGTCHICKKGSEHSISNTGSEDLVLLTFVVER